MIGELAITVSSLLLIVLGLALTFFGRKLVKTIFFIVGGLIGALLTLYLASPIIGEPLIYLAVLVAFIVAGFLFYKLLPIGAGLIASFTAFYLLEPVLGLMVAIIIALIVFVVIAVLFNKLLSIGTALLGSIIFVAGLSQLTPLNNFIQLLLIVVLTILGSVVQFKT
ncbi:MAG: hypothetical protein N3F65_00525 [Nitrososphaeria archaeon]|nr:hypothetical protein [Aigarchaeota archaeon]MCX8187084.1 hypothetical protein [Nitrososphaeria archaeon]MDW8021379.1 hypothetical protein [Nitrososphaerota archaeon]